MARKSRKKSRGSLSSGRHGSLSPKAQAMGDGTVTVTEQPMTPADYLAFYAEEYNPLGIALAGMKSTVAMITSSSTQAAIAAGDKPQQTADGSGSISISDFKNVGGTCKPMNWPAFNFAKALQNQMNRVAAAKKWSRIGSDGEIGPGTMTLFAKIKAAFPTVVMGDTSSCAFIAADADVLADQVKQAADSIGAPAQVAGTPSAAPSIVTASGKTLIAPTSATGASALDAFGGMSSGQKLVFVGLVGGIGYAVLHKKKKRKGK